MEERQTEAGFKQNITATLTGVSYPSSYSYLAHTLLMSLSCRSHVALYTRSIRGANIKTKMVSRCFLLLNWIDVKQCQHEACNNSREYGEQKPYHTVDCISISDGDDGLTRCIGTRNEACKA